MATRPRVFPGRCSPANKGAVDWGWQNLVAYGCFSYIVVFDPFSLRIVQTLDEHNSPVVAVKWRPQAIAFDSNEDSYKLQLASGDMSGQIYIWSVSEGTIGQTLWDESNATPILQLEWLPKGSRHLAALHKSAQIVVWDIDSGSVQWRLSFNEEMVSFAFDPLSILNICCATSTGWVYFAKGAAKTEPPLVEQKFRISPIQDPKAKGKVVSQELRQVHYHPWERNLVFFVMTREVIVFDLRVNQTVGTIMVERGKSSIVRILPCRDYPRLVICLHENGSLSAWESTKKSYGYELKSMWEIVRANNPSRKGHTGATGVVAGKVMATQTRLVLVSNEGTVWVWEYTYATPLGEDRPLLSHIGQREKFAIRGMVEMIPAPVRTMAVCRLPVEKESFTMTEPLVAIGTFAGNLQIFDASDNSINTELTITNNIPVRCVRWINQHTLLAFSCEEMDKGQFKNNLFHVDLRTGKITTLRKEAGIETTFIRTIKLSHTRKYFILLLKDRPFELWDSVNLVLIRAITSQVPVSSLCWSPNVEYKPTVSGLTPEEKFVVTAPGGQFHYYSVENGVITKNQVQVDANVGVVSALGWKGPHLVTGDTNGNVHCLDFDRRSAKTFVTNLGVVRRIQFAPGEKHHCLVLFKDGDFAIWDVDTGVRLSTSSYLRGRDIRAIDIDWLTDSQPILACNDGCLRILDKNLAQSNSPFNFGSSLPPENFFSPLYTPYLLTGNKAWALRAILESGKLEYLDKFSALSEKSDNVFALERENNKISIPVLLRQAIEIHKDDTAERCRKVSEFFGEDEMITFWTLASHVLKIHQKKVDLQEEDGEEKEQESEKVGEEQRETEGEGNKERKERPVEEDPPDAIPLPLYFGTLRTSRSLRESEQLRVQLEYSQRDGYDLNKINIHHQILLGNTERAVELLLETPRDHGRFVIDALKACVVAATDSPSSFHRTVLLVAHHFISLGYLNEGLELLVLIGKGEDACQYLQSCDKWEDAVWLAKLTGTPSEIRKIISQWCNQLIETKEYQQAILLLLSLGRFQDALQILHEMQWVHTAAMFYRTCCEYKVLPIPENIPNEKESLSERKKISPSRELIPLQTLFQTIHLDYGFFLYQAEEYELARNNWVLAGPPGERMIEQFLDAMTIVNDVVAEVEDAPNPLPASELINLNVDALLHV